MRLQRLVYNDVRATYGLMAQHTVRAIAVVAASYKADKEGVHSFREDAAVCLDTPRLYRIVHNRASITTLDGRLKVALGIGGHQWHMLKDAVKLVEADLIRSGYRVRGLDRDTGAYQLSRRGTRPSAVGRTVGRSISCAAS